MIRTIAREARIWVAFRPTQVLLGLMLLAGLGVSLSGQQVAFFLSAAQFLFMLWVCQFVGNEYLWGTLSSQMILSGLTRKNLWLVKASLIGLIGIVYSLLVFMGTVIANSFTFNGMLFLEILLSILLYGYFGFLIAIITRSVSLANTLSIMLFLFDYIMYFFLPVFVRLEDFTHGQGPILSIGNLFTQISIRSNAMNGLDGLFLSPERALLGMLVILTLEIAVAYPIFQLQEIQGG